MKQTTFLLTLLALLFLVSSVLAMESDNYRLDWFTPLTSGGGGAASSAHYAVNLTVGQCHQVKGASAGRVGPKGRIETKRAALATSFTLPGPHRGFDTLRYSTDGA